jgi:DHA1 family multidrug resistance protein-like MFS transporter
VNPVSFRARIFTLEITIFVSMLGVGIIVPFLPLYARQMGASAFVMGAIFSSFSLARGLTMPYVGSLSDRHGRKIFIIIGLLGYALLAVALIWASSPWELVLNRVLQGVFAAMVLPVSMALVADLTPSGQEGVIFGGFNTYFLLGFAVGPLIGGVTYDYIGLSANFLLMAGLSFTSLLMVLFLVREPKKVRKAVDKGGWAEQFALLKDRPLFSVFLARALSAVGMGCFVAFLPVLTADKGLSNTELGWLLAVNVLVMTGLQKPCGWLADRWSRVGLAAMGLSLSGVCKGLLPLPGSFSGLMTLCVLEGVAAGLALPALTALAVSHGRRLGAGMGVTMGSFGMAMSLGVSVGPLGAGLLADWLGIGSIFYLAGGATIIGAACLFLPDRPIEPVGPPVARHVD